MRIQRLLLTDFRSCSHVDLRPSEGINILTGANAQGKSTLLEAIYVLATSRSPRAGKDVEMIRWGQPVAVASAEVLRDVRDDVGVEISFSQTEKRVMRVNHVRRTKVPDLVGQLNAVLFSAGDLDLVHGEPSVRRRFLNLEISQISPQYCHLLLQYRRILEQRNRLLKAVRETGKDTDTLEAWDEQLIQAGSRLVERRVSFLEELSGHAVRIPADLAGQGEELSVSYQPSFALDVGGSVAESFGVQLRSRRGEEVARGVTVVGPHRDDVAFVINGADARVFASQGQQRTIALATKLAEVELMRDRVGEAPVVLLDDAGSELDAARRDRLFALVTGGYQAFVACTDAASLPAEVLRRARQYRVEKGAVREQPAEEMRTDAEA